MPGHSLFFVVLPQSLAPPFTCCFGAQARKPTFAPIFSFTNKIDSFCSINFRMQYLMHGEPSLPAIVRWSDGRGEPRIINHFIKIKAFD